MLREGALILARAGRTDAAVERLARAEALVGGGHEVVLRAEAAIVLAEADRLAEAEPRCAARSPSSRRPAAPRTGCARPGRSPGPSSEPGRTDEAEQVWPTSGGPVTAPTGR